MCPSLKWRGWKQWLLIGVAACVSMHFAGRRAAADLTVLFTASTDYTLNLNGGYSYPNDPNNQNPYLPAIPNGVTLTPPTGGLNYPVAPLPVGPLPVGPLPDGTSYGPFGYSFNAGGTTGWVTSTYTFTTAGTYQIIWEVASVLGSQGGDALAADNITLTPSNGTPTHLVQFSPNALLPSGYTGLGNYGTSASVPGLSTSGGDPGFAYIDVGPDGYGSTGVTPIFDTSGEVYSASQLYSSLFTVSAGDVLSIDSAFLTSDGSPYSDYGAVALQLVPEPSSLVIAALGILGMAGFAERRHAAQASRL